MHSNPPRVFLQVPSTHGECSEHSSTSSHSLETRFSRKLKQNTHLSDNGRDRKGWDGMGWDGTGRDGTGRAGPGRAGTGRDGPGRDGERIILFYMDNLIRPGGLFHIKVHEKNESDKVFV